MNINNGIISLINIPIVIYKLRIIKVIKGFYKDLFKLKNIYFIKIVLYKFSKKLVFLLEP